MSFSRTPFTAPVYHTAGFVVSTRRLMTTCEPTAREVLLEGQVASLTGELQQLREEVERLQQEKRVLRLKIDALSRKLFGRSSEKLSPDQLQLV